MKRSITYIFLLFSIGLSAQSNLGIKNVDGDTFRVFIDSQLIANRFDTEFKVLNINNGSHLVKTQFPDGTTTQKTVFLKKGIEHWFELKADSVRTKIVFYNTFPVEQTDTARLNKTIVVWKEMNLSEAGTEPTEIMDTLGSKFIPTIQLESKSDSILSDSLGTFTEPIYQGNVGCDQPSSNFETMFEDALDVSFNSEKLDWVRSYLKNSCLKVSQLDRVLTLFEFEDHKLEVVQLLYQNVYDLDNIVNLESHFQLGRLRERFYQLVDQQ